MILTESTTASPWRPYAPILLGLLSIMAMLQPSGRLLGKESRYCVYLRSSPFFCAATVISLFSHIAVWLWCKIQGQQVSFLDFIAHLAPEEPRPILDKIWQRERSTYEVARSTAGSMVYTAFSSPLVSIFPATKLLSMTGMPWTQAWGWCFILSIPQSYWTLTLGNLGRYQRRAPAAVQPATKEAPPTRHNASFDNFLFCIACIAHTSLLIYLTKTLWSYYDHSYFSSGWASMPAPGTVIKGPYPLYVDILLIIGRDILFLISVFMPISNVFASYSLRNTYSQMKAYSEVAWCLFYIVSSWSMVYSYGRVEMAFDWFWMVAFVGLPVGAWYAVMSLGDRYPKVGKILLLRSSQQMGGIGKMDGEACFYFVGFAWTAVLSIFYYALKVPVN